MTTENDLISVIIPTYNRAHTLSRAIDSVLNQTYKNWEIIIVDDGSTDDTEKQISEFLKDTRISYFRIEHQGVCAARNFGIERAKGIYVALLDSDDEFLTTKLEVQVGEMKKSKYDFSLCNRIIDTDGGRKEKKLLSQDFDLPKIIMGVQGVVSRSCSLMVFRKDILQDVRFDALLESFNDLDFLIKIIVKNKILFIGEPLTIIHKTLKFSRISTSTSAKISGSKKILDRINANYYEVDDRSKDLIKREMLFSFGAYNFLEGNYILSRSTFKLLLASRLKLKVLLVFKVYILILFSYFPILAKLIMKVYKKLWLKGFVT